MKKSVLIIITILFVVVICALVYALFVFNNIKKLQKESKNPPIENIDSLIQASENIRVSSPEKDSLISSPIKITGEARVFENTFVVRLKDSSGKALIEESKMTQPGEGMGYFNPFEVELSFSSPKTATGTIEVFQYSPKDGAEIDKVIIPIIFK